MGPHILTKLERIRSKKLWTDDFADDDSDKESGVTDEEEVDNPNKRKR